MISVAINALGMGKELVGTGQYAYQLIHNLTKIDRINRYLIIRTKFSPLDNLRSENVKYIDFAVSNRIKRVLLENIVVPNIMRKNKLDLFYSPLFTIPLSLPVPSVVTIHDTVFHKFPEMLDKVRRIYLKSAIGYSILNSDRIIAVSESTKKDIVDNFNVPDTRIHVVYGAAAPCFRRIIGNDLIRHTCKKYRIRQPFLLNVGTLEPRKNLVRLIRAYHILKRDHKINHKLVITGRKGWNYNEVFSEVERLSLRGHVIFTGYVSNEDLVHLYNGAELFILPSLYEGFGLPILEAMACGIPVITSNTSSMPEVAGDGALLVDPYDVGALVEAIHEILTNEEIGKRLTMKGFERVKKFSWERCARQTLEVFNRLCKKGI